VKVLLVDADRTGFPNLALMKLSAYHKKTGNVVGLLGRDKGPTNPDEVHVSCVFTWNAPYILGLTKMFNCPIHIGGSGVGFEPTPYFFNFSSICSTLKRTASLTNSPLEAYPNSLIFTIPSTLLRRSSGN